MSETEQLQAVAGKIAECLSQVNPGAPMPNPVMVVATDIHAELRPTVNGVEYKILVSVVTDQERGGCRSVKAGPVLFCVDDTGAFSDIQ